MTKAEKLRLAREQEISEVLDEIGMPEKMDDGMFPDLWIQWVKAKMRKKRPQNPAEYFTCRMGEMIADGLESAKSTLKQAIPVGADITKILRRSADFIGKWAPAYQKHLGRPYGATSEDRGALKRFWASQPESVDQLIAVAMDAWARIGRGSQYFFCKHSSTIRGFCRHFHSIQTELATAGGPARVNQAYFATADKSDMITPDSGILLSDREIRK